MVKRTVTLICFMLINMLFGLAIAETQHTFGSERILLEQPLLINNNVVDVRVWLDTRQVFQQQALRVHVTVIYGAEFDKISIADVRTTANSDWTQPMVMPEADVSHVATGRQAEWVMMIYPKHVGVFTLPNLQLQFEGKSLARKWVTIPNVAIRVMPLPVFVPSEAIVGKFIHSETSAQEKSLWLVGDVGQRKTQMQIANMMPNTMVAYLAQGEGIEGLSSMLEDQAFEWQDHQIMSNISLWQPWRMRDVGRWHLAEQDVWVFDPETWQVSHLVLAAQAGWTIPVWLWQTLKAFVVIFFSVLLMAVTFWLHCRLKRHQYMQKLKHSTDMKQLIAALRDAWHKPDHVPLAHAFGQQHALFSIAAQLEGALFSQQTLFNATFEALKSELLKKDVFPPCMR